MGILKNTGKFILALIVSLLVYKFISYNLLGERTAQETLSENGNVKQKKSEINIDKILHSAADSVNIKCPIVIDKITTLVSATIFQGKVFQYNYILKIDTAKYNMSVLKINLKKILLDNYINNEMSKDFRFNKVTINYFYQNSKGDSLFKLTFSPDKYE